MLKYRPPHVLEAKLAFQSWQQYLGGKCNLKNPIFDDKPPQNCNEQERFDSFIKTHFGNDRCFGSNGETWRQMAPRRLQAMYTLKNHLRRNWRMLDIKPRFEFFYKGEEEHCYLLNQTYVTKKSVVIPTEHFEPYQHNHRGDSRNDSSNYHYHDYKKRKWDGSK